MEDNEEQINDVGMSEIVSKSTGARAGQSAGDWIVVVPVQNQGEVKAGDVLAAESSVVNDPQEKVEVEGELKIEPITESDGGVLAAGEVIEEPLPVVQVEEADGERDLPEPLLRKEGMREVVPEKIVEKIIEVERKLTDADKESIHRQKLAEGLIKANTAKHAQYEKHLQEIVDFIRARGTLVTNQEIEEGLKIPDATVTYRLDELMQRGLVIRLGSGFDAKYRLKGAV